MPSAARLLSVFPLGVMTLAALTLVACQPAQETADSAPAPEREPVRVENADLGVAVADLDSFFQVSSTDGATIVLRSADPAVAGELTISAAEPKAAGGVNLVAAIEEHKASVEARGGEFKGQRELGGPLGTAFYSRGHYTAEDGTPTEETKIHTVHPHGDRVLHLTYVYPQGEDSAQRIQDQLFAVLGELVPAEAAPDSNSEASSDPAAAG
jgi:hypothetical protein